MPLDSARARQRLKDFELKALFVEELGWEHHAAAHQVTADGHSYRLSAVAHKRGFAVFICEPAADGRIPDYATRRKIDRQVTKFTHEHLVIFVDQGKTTQIWQWLKKELGKPAACREHTFYRQQPGDSLIQRLERISFSIDEEPTLSLPEVAGRIKAGLYDEKVTKRFYDRFKTEHAAFLKFLKGIPDEEMQRWYVSVMLNRLMFNYFIQKKGFLDGKQDYLRVKLAETKKRGKDRFYRDFLCPLFFEGFAKKESERSAATNKLLGKVPYLNGGLFLRHQIEELHGDEIQIADKVFDKLFTFFEQYHWHLDERPLKNDREINPDVLGYIFEKYINQKQMGAYYSKEDITGYISQSTVIPFLFDQARKECRIAFESGHSIWRLLQNDPDRYMYDTVRKGVHLKLPPEIAAGLKGVSKRTGWNRPAHEEYALPTEIWREVVARRKRYKEVRGKLAGGEIRSINNLITYNLDIRQFAQDVIESCEGPELLRAFYKAIKNVSVLDPACGSGAFLFAALNILESLYEACLDRMQVFLDELKRSGQKHRPEKFVDFKKELERVDQHPNRKYFVFKSIIVNNLFGVDIMGEATEICKLRLFLKLVAQIERLDQIEPLPDIDFNVRAGNTLVGYASYEDVKRAVTSKFDFEKTMDRIEEKAQEIARLFALFREMQSDRRMESREFTEAKQDLLRRLKVLEGQLNGYLAGEYGIKPSDHTGLERWKHSHRPFHWFIEFYEIMSDGGFDVIVGNPPYVEYKEVRDQYRVLRYKTIDCGDLYAFFMERSLVDLMRADGRVGLIVPVSSVSTDRFAMLQRLLLDSSQVLWASTYAERPSKLFAGVEKRLAIHLIARGRKEAPLFLTKYQRWNASERFCLLGTEEQPALFHRLRYVGATEVFPQIHNRFRGSIPKVGSELELNILKKLFSANHAVGEFLVKNGNHTIYYTRKLRYFIQFFNFVPRILDEAGRVQLPSELKELNTRNEQSRACLLSILNSSLFFWFFVAFSDCRNVNRREILAFPLDLNSLSRGSVSRLSALSQQLMESFQANSNVLSMYYKGRGTLRIQTFQPRNSKDIINEIDRELAGLYGLTDEEADFIIHHDVKYRMGYELEEAEN